MDASDVHFAIASNAQQVVTQGPVGTVTTRNHCGMEKHATVEQVVGTACQSLSLWCWSMINRTASFQIQLSDVLQNSLEIIYRGSSGIRV